jgi:hypothetical protein
MGVVARTLASSLLRTARRGLPEGAVLNLRPPVDQEWGTFRDDAPPPGFGELCRSHTTCILRARQVCRQKRTTQHKPHHKTKQNKATSWRR